MDIGILLFAGAVVFSVITLPVEFDASKRAMALLSERGFLVGNELDGARKVLSAAALTYVASTAMAVMQLAPHVPHAELARLGSPGKAPSP